MIEIEVAREAALLIANSPDRHQLVAANAHLRTIIAGIRQEQGRWRVSPAARECIGRNPPATALARLRHAAEVLGLALSWLGLPAGKH